MSKGPGRVQRKLTDALATGERYTVEELAGVVFPGEAIGPKHKSSVRRSLGKLGVTIHKSRAGTWGAKGWRYRIGLAGCTLALASLCRHAWL